ncbi:nucleotidyltransferase domain-containing protein [archaeon]|nr:nucleotidyltransferase domain-containing protein [archaeon]
MELLKEVLSEIKPKQSKIKEAEEFIKKINFLIKKKGIKAKAVFGGSYSKKTWLKGDADIDIFVKFDMKYSDENLSQLLASLIKQFKPQKVHGSRDYFQINNSLKFEIVPVLNIKKPQDAHNVTDFSPLHVKWANKARKSDEILLAKKFFKANKVYGAESYIKGFSGHVVDILTIFYGSFLGLIKSVSKWGSKTIIDPEKRYKNKNPLFVLNKSKISGPLIVIDPVQPDRNAASVVSQEKYQQLITAAKSFLESPSKKFFEEQKKDFSKVKGSLLILEISPLKGKKDVVGSKLLKVFEYLKNKIEDFELIDSGWDWNKTAKFFFVLKKNILPEEVVREGPLLKFEEHVKNFKKIHSKTFIKNDRINASVKRAHTEIRSFIEDLIKQDFVIEKVSSIKLI